MRRATAARVDELCAAAIRALTGERDLHLRGARLRWGDGRTAHAPNPHPIPDGDLAASRGAADGMALRVRHSDPEVHRASRPADPVRRLVFEMLEQFRVEALAPPELPGVTRNLRHRHVVWSLGFHHRGLTGTSRGILLYTVAQVCRARVTGEPAVEGTEDVLEHTRAALAPAIGDDLAALRRERHDQVTYAEHALSIARTVGELINEASDEDEDSDDEFRLPLFLDNAEDAVENATSVSTQDSQVFARAEPDYRIFTSEHDRQCDASDLVRPALLKEYREHLDRRIAEHGVNLPRLARTLLAVLSQPAVDGWDSGQEEGHIDGRRLTRLITSPGDRRLFRAERISPVTDASVTFLIDCSGSMKEHAEPVAVLVDVFARALELAGASSEVLGFTTGGFNGGQVMRDWIRAGRPAHPGRLNELRHLVFKTADTPWRRARFDLAALLKRDLFREGVDGEAVTWARARAETRLERQRLLLVLSDGGPMDSATVRTNDNHYLDRHLEDVVRRTEMSGSVRIQGLGVGLDLSPYYHRSHALDLSHGTGNQVLHEVVAAISAGGYRQQHRRR